MSTTFPSVRTRNRTVCRTACRAALATAALSLITTTVLAQHVKGNEAVTQTAQGRQVQTPPLPKSVGKPCAVAAKCHAAAWRMVETQAGLVECTEAYARPGTCRESTYGVDKLPRLWVVKRGADWLQCQYPDLNSKCAPMFARPPANLPMDAVQ